MKGDQMDNSYRICQFVDPAYALPHEPAIQALAKQLQPNISNEKIALARNRFMDACSNHIVFVAIQDPADASECDVGELVGLAILVRIIKLSGLEGHVEDVIVLEAHQRKGIAKALMAHLLDYAKASKMSSVSLTSNPNNPTRAPAINLYRKLGFEPADGLMRIKF